jgi:signal peptidase I
MSHTHDDSRDEFPGQSGEPRPSDRWEAEPGALPAPEPLVPAEPAPTTFHGFSAASDSPSARPTPTGPTPDEVSWRTLVGGQRETVFRDVPSDAPHTPEVVPGSAEALAEVNPSAAAFAPPPIDPAVVRHPVQPQPSITLARVGEELFAWLKTLASAAVYATLIVTFGFQVARVEGQSMAPTLEDQDRLIVNKLAYRIGDPQVGDIVMLYYPLNPEKSFVKRVIAEEGDQIRIVDGRVYRNDVLIPDDYVPSEFRGHDDYGPEVVPQGYYFVMGDHRNNSSDSRHWKHVPKKYIIGKVQLRWWPIPAARVF